MQQSEIIVHATGQPGIPLMLKIADSAPLSVNPQVPNALERDLASANIGPFGWIGIAFLIILAVCAGMSIFKALKKPCDKNTDSAGVPSGHN